MAYMIEDFFKPDAVMDFPKVRGQFRMCLVVHVIIIGNDINDDSDVNDSTNANLITIYKNNSNNNKNNDSFII